METPEDYCSQQYGAFYSNEEERLPWDLSRDFIGAYFLAGLEAYGFSGRYGNLLAGSGISSHAAFPGFDNKDPKATQLNPFATLQRILKRIEHRFHRNFRSYLGDIQLLCHTVYDVLLYHAGPPIS